MIRFGISGCGLFVKNAVLPNMLRVDNAEVAAVYDYDSSKAGGICDEFGIGKVCSTFDDLLAADVDAIYIAAPNAFHKDQAIAAARAGKHVFCQKPLGMNAIECREMIDVCRDMGVKLGVGFCYRFQGAQRRAKEMIAAGEIGEVSYIHMSFNLGGYNPETVGWRCNPAMSGGGPLMDIAPHMIDLASFLLDDRVDSTMAYVHPLKTEREIEMDVLAMLQFGKGARATIDTSFVRGNLHNYSIIGSEGQINAYGTMAWQTGGKLVLCKGCDEQEVVFPMTEHIEEELRLYCDSLESGHDVPVSGDAGLHVQAVIDAIYKSGETGERSSVLY